MRSRHVLVITYWRFNDALIQTYTLPYLKLIQEELPTGSRIFLLTLETFPDQNNKVLDMPWLVHVPLKYYPFGLKAMLMWIKSILSLLFLVRRQNIDTIHAWCTPAGAIGLILSLLSRKHLILDSFEPHAQSMVEGKTWKPQSLAYRILFFLEKWQLKRAKEVICTVSAMISYSQQHYKVIKSRYFSKPACVDLELFSEKQIKNKGLLQELDLNDKITCVYAGKFGGIYLDEEIILFIQHAFEYFGESFRFLLLSSESQEYIQNLFKKYKIPNHILIQRFVNHNEVSVYMGLGDFAICPVKPMPTKRFSTPIKNGEYWALGLPIIIPTGISEDSDIIEKEGIGYVWKSVSQEEFKKSLIWIDQYLKSHTRQEIYQKIRPIAEKYRNFSIAKAVYQNIYGPESSK